MSRWAVVGSGPSGHGLTGFDLAGRTVVVVDTAIERVPREAVDYHITPHGAVPGTNLYGLLLDGVQVVSIAPYSRVVNPSRPSPKIEGLEFLGLPRRAPDMYGPRWVKGEYTSSYDPIGPLGIQYSVNAGATLVEVWGFEGFDWPAYAKSLRRRAGDVNEHRLMCMLQQRHLQDVITACPEVRFVFYGRLFYELEGDNVECDPVACACPARL